MKSIILFIIIIVISLPGSYLKAQKSFQMKAELAKTHFITYERIDLGIEIKNVSNSIIKENFRHNVHIKIFDQNGKEIPRKGLSTDNFSPYKDEFKINEEWFNVVELNDFFGKELSFFTTSRYYDPGKYIIKISFKPPHSEEITDNISFQVTKPTGDEAIVFTTLLQIFDNAKNGKYKGSEYPEALYSLHIYYPYSVYSPQMLDIIGAVYQSFLNDQNKSDMISKELLEKYPWSPLGRGMLNIILKKMKSDKERRDYIMKLLPGSKNYPMHRVLENLLKELKNNTWKK